MSTDDDKKDEDLPSPTPQVPARQVVITHFGKKRKKEEADVPAEIMPTSPSHILSSPVDGVSPALTKNTASLPPPQKTLEEKGIPGMAATESPTFTVPPRMDFPAPEEISEPDPIYSHPHFETTSEQIGVSSEENEARHFTPDHPAPPPAPPRLTEQNGWTANMSLFLSLITTIAVVALVYNAYNSQQELNELQQLSRSDKSSVQLLASQAKAALSQLEEVRDQNLNQQKVLGEFKDQLEGAQNQLVTLSGGQNWILSEANYLVFMANERLQTAHDVFSALAQLEAADQRLEALGPAYLWVREVLAKDLAVLRSQPKINRQALWEQVALMIPAIQALSFKSMDFASAPAAEKTPEPDSHLAPWRQALWRSWQEFKGLVRISKESDNTIPLALSAEEKAEVMRAGELMAEQIQWAILQGNDTVYNQNLNKIKNWLENYFAADPKQSALINQIDQLQQQQVQLAIPDITNSIHALSQALLDISSKSPNQNAVSKDKK